MKNNQMIILSKEQLYRIYGGGNINDPFPDTDPGDILPPPDKPIGIPPSRQIK